VHYTFIIIKSRICTHKGRVATWSPPPPHFCGQLPTSGANTNIKTLIPLTNTHKLYTTVVITMTLCVQLY